MLARWRKTDVAEILVGPRRTERVGLRKRRIPTASNQKGSDAGEKGVVYINKHSTLPPALPILPTMCVWPGYKAVVGCRILLDTSCVDRSYVDRSFVDRSYVAETDTSRLNQHESGHR